MYCSVSFKLLNLALLRNASSVGFGYTKLLSVPQSHPGQFLDFVGAAVVVVLNWCFSSSVVEEQALKKCSARHISYLPNL